MRSVFLRFLPLILVCTACSRLALPPETTTVPQGTTSSGGGTPYKVEFKDVGRTVIRRLQARDRKQVAGVSVDELEKTLERLEVTLTESVLTKDGGAVDALNFPSTQKVLLSLVRWAPHMSFAEKRRLVIHEVLGLMQKPDKDFELTDQILALLGFLQQTVDIGSFQVTEEIAKTFVEKMPWRTKEVTIDDTSYPQHRTTYYSALRGGAPNTGAVQCRKIENFIKDYEHTAHFCWIVGQASITDGGTILIRLGPQFTEEQRHPLGRMFDDLKEDTFDYGVMKGYRGSWEIEIFP